jgi:hypothetical protein
MRLVTFFAECTLPYKPAQKSAGFDWRQACRALAASAAKSLGVGTDIVTDAATVIQGASLRVGDAKRDGVMLWLLDAQAAAIRAMPGRLLMVSPDTLIAGPLDCMFGDWDICLLTRDRPKPLINSVIAVQASARLADWWDGRARAGRDCSPESQAWGADVDVLVEAVQIQPSEDCVREVDGLMFRLLPAKGIFRSVDMVGRAQRYPHPIWDFKGQRKIRMPEYAALL